MLREQGVPIEQATTITALLTLVWAMKFLWAPIVDVLRGPRWTLRAWIVTSQSAMALTLLSLLWIEPAQSLGLLTGLLFLHAFAAATQDVAIDALAIRSTSAEERGALNGWMQAGMLLGRSVFGGGALIARGYWGDDAVILILVGILCVTLSSTLLFRDETSLVLGLASAQERLRAFIGHLRGALRLRSLWFGLAFAATGGAAFEAVGAVAGPFLVDRDHGDVVGWFFAVPSVVCMLAGALAGGYASDRFGRKTTIVAASAWMSAAVLCLALLDASIAPAGPVSPAGLLACLTAMYFGIGLFTASTYALFMDMTDPALGSTQFSAFMGATNLCEAWAVFVVGRLIAGAAYPESFTHGLPLSGAGYPAAFATMAFVAVLALPLLLWMRPFAKRDQAAHA
jgi:MFS family permease